MRKKSTLIILIISMLLTACGIQQADETAGKPLRIQFSNWWGDYTLIVAQQAGIFEKHNVAVEPVFYETFSDAPPELAAGYADAGLFAIGDVINVSPHAPLRVVAVYDAGGTNDVVAIPQIQTVSDLRGKTIGVSLGTPYELYILEMLKNAGLKASDVNLVNVVPENVPAAMGTTIQAGYVWEPYKSQALSAGNKILSSSQTITGLFPDVIVFREKTLQERPEDVKAFLAAWFEAVEFRSTHAQEANQMVADYLDIPLAQVTGDARILTLEENLALFSETPPAGMKSILETTKINAEFLLDIGTISKLPDYEFILTDQFLK
jgi:NitT/TauT family transport system substrate-binding protein